MRRGRSFITDLHIGVFSKKPNILMPYKGVPYTVRPLTSRLSKGREVGCRSTTVGFADKGVFAQTAYCTFPPPRPCWCSSYPFLECTRWDSVAHDFLGEQDCFRIGCRYRRAFR